MALDQAAFHLPSNNGIRKKTGGRCAEGRCVYEMDHGVSFRMTLVGVREGSFVSDGDDIYRVGDQER